MRFLIRLAILVALFCGPFLLFVLLNRRNGNAGMVLVVLFFFTLPVALGALVIYAPLERLLDARGLGHVKNLAVPLLSAAVMAVLAMLFLLVMDAFDKAHVVPGQDARTIADRLPGIAQLGAVLGAVGGVLWRFSDWAAKLLGAR
jgi:hypothetical protein